MVFSERKGSVPVTNGMKDEQLYNAVTREPKELNKNGGLLSMTYG